MKTIITYGTFDIIHHGHVLLLKQAKEMGDYLIVGLSTDEFNAIKGKKAFNSYERRKIMLEGIKYVDLVIPEENWEQKIDDIKKYNVDTLVMGSDWKDSDRFEYLKEYCNVVFFDRVDDMSSTKIKDTFREEGRNSVN